MDVPSRSPESFRFRDSRQQLVSTFLTMSSGFFKLNTHLHWPNSENCRNRGPAATRTSIWPSILWSSTGKGACRFTIPTDL